MKFNFKLLLDEVGVRQKMCAQFHFVTGMRFQSGHTGDIADTGKHVAIIKVTRWSTSNGFMKTRILLLLKNLKAVGTHLVEH